MGLFKRDYNKPGPGVPKNAPKKKGVARFFEIFARDFSNLVKLNLLYVLCCIPSVVLFVVALTFFMYNFWLFLLFGLLALLGGCLVGPALTATYALVTRMLRDEPGFIWHEFKRLFKENFKSGILPGVVYCLLVGSQVIGIVYYFLSAGNVGIVQTVLYLFSILLFNMAVPYYFLQAAYIDLDKLGILKNSFLFALGYLPRTIAGMLLSLAFTVGFGLLTYLFLPAFIIPLFIGVTVPLLVKMMWYWPQVDKTFNIDETLRDRNTEAIDDRMIELGEHDKVVGKPAEDDSDSAQEPVDNDDGADAVTEAEENQE